MAGTRIETGDWTPHDTTGAAGNVLHPLDPSAAASPGVQDPTAIATAPLPPTMPAMDYAGFFAAVQGDALAECEAAMPRGMLAEDDRRAGYQAQILPLGNAYGEQMTVPVVPEDAVAPAGGFLYPEGGLQPTPTQAGEAGPFPGYAGDEPH